MRHLAAAVAALFALFAAGGAQSPSAQPEPPAQAAVDFAGTDEETVARRPSRQTLVVVSPHLDDAALSLGATIARAARAGVRVVVLTVFAGDPSSREPAGVWDRLCGFATAGDAARSRREEDARACAILGAEPVWLPFAYGDYASGRDLNEVWDAVESRVADAELLFLPGHPLEHVDHASLTRLVAERAGGPLGLYVEQPYANLAAIPRGHLSRPGLTSAAELALGTERARTRLRPAEPEAVAAVVDAPVTWYAACAGRDDRKAKYAAIAMYGSQLRWLGRRLVPRIRLYERGWGGEGVGLVEETADPDCRSAGVPIWDVREWSARAERSLV